MDGVMRLRDSLGHEVRIDAAKCQGLLALLATSPNGLRTRPWLQAKLWSDRAPEQASGSLRQALSQLRKILEPVGVSLTATRRDVQLNLETVEIEMSGNAEFLEGIDVKDSEFEEWLTLERSHKAREFHEEQSKFQAPAILANGSLRALPKQTDWQVSVIASQEGTQDGWFEQLLCDGIARSLRESLNAVVSVHVEKPGDTSEGLLTVKAQAQRFDDRLLLRLTLADNSNNHQIWSGYRDLPLRGGPPIEHTETLSLVCELTDALFEFVRSNSAGFELEDPDVVSLFAIDDLFSIDSERLRQADQRFAQAFENKPRGLYLAWLAQVRTIQVVEKFTDAPKEAIEEAIDLSRRALEMEPTNSMVAALSANVAGHLEKDIDRSIELGMLSVRLNPANPMSGNALSSGRLYSSELELGYQQAFMSRKLALLSKHRFWWDQQLFGSSFILGRLDEAYRLARSAHALNPNFRPSLRYLIALCAHFGEFELAKRHVESLKALEPGFDVHQLLQDHEYPASLIKRAPGLSIDKVREML